MRSPATDSRRRGRAAGCCLKVPSGRLFERCGVGSTPRAYFPSIRRIASCGKCRTSLLGSFMGSEFGAHRSGTTPTLDRTSTHLPFTFTTNFPVTELRPDWTMSLSGTSA